MAELEALKSYVGGCWVPGGRRRVVLKNPGRLDRVACRFISANPETAGLAMDAAQAAFDGWRRRPAARRVRILEEILLRLEGELELFAGLITAETGKTLREARLEVAAGLKDARFLLAEAGRAARGEPGPRKPGSGRMRVMLEPVGVYVLITPWNFPLATVLRKLIPALAFGNTAVLKPSELAPGPAAALFRLFDEAGLPEGIANLVLGSGRSVGGALADHAALRGITFTGSTRVGLELAKRTAGRDVRLQLEMGGKNSLVVLADADMDAAIDAAVVGGFSCAGQWCTGTGRVIVEAPIYAEFCRRLVRRARRLRVGPGNLERVDLGPLISRERVRATTAAVRTAIRHGARVLCGGQALPESRGRRGWYFVPTVLADVSPDNHAFLNELFAPVVPVARAKDAEEALALANAGEFGLSASIFTGDRRMAQRFTREVEAGIVHVNLHTAYRHPELPVAGWRESGRGTPECGRFARDFFTRPRAEYWSGSLSGPGVKL